jgi:stage II sporulation protein AA (anti-sigma F factor antagonist)
MTMQDPGAKPPDLTRTMIPSDAETETAARRQRHPMTMTVEQAERLHVWLSGEFDLAQVEAFTSALDEVYEAEIVLDLSELKFIDSSGIRALLLLHQRVLHDDGNLSLVLDGSPIARTFELAGVMRILDVVDADSAAHSAASRGRQIAG